MERNGLDWRALFFPPLVERDQGLYRQGQLALGVAKAGVLVAAGIGVIAFGQWYLMGAVYLALAAFLGWRQWQDRRSFGPLGRPLVRVRDGVAFFSLPSRLVPRQVEVVLQEVKALTLQGDAFRRVFVFERRHGEATRFTTAYGVHDERVLAFLRQQMPPKVRLVLTEPSAALGPSGHDRQS
jgi:hypothetical protein